MAVFCNTHEHEPGNVGVQAGFAGFSTDVSARSIAYYNVVFPHPFVSPPNVVITPMIGSTAYQVGSHLVSITPNSITATGFQVKWFDGETSNRWPAGVQWIAVGELAE